MIDCAHALEQLDAYQDGELDSSHAAALERHLAACPDCARTRATQAELSQAVRALAPYHFAPARLRAQVESLVRPPARGMRDVSLRLWQLLGLVAASAALSATCVLMVPRLATREPEAALVALVDAHARSLMENHLLDVVSTDRHTVKPWFAGRLDYAPPVRDLQAAGFTLAGGRVDYVDGRRVAALVYVRRQHRINVFVWPAGNARIPRAPATVNGFHALGWKADGMLFWAVSDLNVAELQELAAAMQGAASDAAAAPRSGVVRTSQGGAGASRDPG
jgi:anti-sigma factor (TIGR02949 family)